MSVKVYWMRYVNFFAVQAKLGLHLQDCGFKSRYCVCYLVYSGTLAA